MEPPVQILGSARFSFAHGSRDGHPFPVPLQTYDASLSVLRTALDSARAGDREKLDGMRRLDQFVRSVEERHQPEADFDADRSARTCHLARARRKNRHG